jgi:hypothetical protein
MKRCRQALIEHMKRSLTNTNLVKQECVNECQQNTIWGDKEHKRNIASRCQQTPTECNKGGANKC